MSDAKLVEYTSYALISEEVIIELQGAKTLLDAIGVFNEAEMSFGAVVELKDRISVWKAVRNMDNIKPLRAISPQDHGTNEESAGKQQTEPEIPLNRLHPDYNIFQGKSIIVIRSDGLRFKVTRVAGDQSELPYHVYRSFGKGGDYGKLVTVGTLYAVIGFLREYHSSIID